MTKKMEGDIKGWIKTGWNELNNTVKDHVGWNELNNTVKDHVEWSDIFCKSGENV